MLRIKCHNVLQNSIKQYTRQNNKGLKFTSNKQREAYYKFNKMNSDRLLKTLANGGMSEVEERIASTIIERRFPTPQSNAKESYISLIFTFLKRIF